MGVVEGWGGGVANRREVTEWNGTTSVGHADIKRDWPALSLIDGID